MVLTYGDDVYAEVMARSQDWVKWPWKRINPDREYDRELQFLTYLNVVSSSNSPPPAEKSGGGSSRPKLPGKGLKSANFAPQLEEVWKVDSQLLDYEETLGIRVSKARNRNAHIKDTRTCDQVYACSCRGRTCSGKKIIVISLERRSPIQWLPVVPSLEAAVRSWVRPVKWMELARWESTARREEVCRLVVLGYHFWLLRDDAENIYRGICCMYRSKLFELGTAVDGFITGLKVLSQLELIQPGAIDKIAANPNHHLQEVVSRFTGQPLETSLKKTYESRHTMNRLLADLAGLAEKLCTETKALKTIAFAVHEDMVLLGDVLRAAADAPVCSERFGQVKGFFAEFTSSLDIILVPLMADTAWLRESPETKVGYVPVGKNHSAIERLLTSVEVLLVRTKSVYDRVREWDKNVTDIRSGYRKLGM
ncbi:hypothetical protein MFIFM68171_08404 [Madurella fahalii]|uniref:Uncharacterized protein n=1 Tax=Madurella fahalii TaxID=1157608 RepID=A0ABQ0GKH5_9PEZI